MITMCRQYEPHKLTTHLIFSRILSTLDVVPLAVSYLRRFLREPVICSTYVLDGGVIDNGTLGRRVRIVSICNQSE